METQQQEGYGCDVQGVLEDFTVGSTSISVRNTGGNEGIFTMPGESLGLGGTSVDFDLSKILQYHGYNAGDRIVRDTYNIGPYSNGTIPQSFKVLNAIEKNIVITQNEAALIDKYLECESFEEFRIFFDMNTIEDVIRMKILLIECSSLKTYKLNIQDLMSVAHCPRHFLDEFTEEGFFGDLMYSDRFRLYFLSRILNINYSVFHDSPFVYIANKLTAK